MNKPTFIGIAGGSGSGKTSFINDLRIKFSTDEVCIISQDDYYHPREQQIYDDQGVQNFDRPESIDDDALSADLKKLAKGEEVTRKEYVFNNELALASIKTFKPAPVIIVEGLFVFHYQAVINQLDFRVFIHADGVRKLKRRILRDQSERNYPIEDVLYRYEAHVLPSFQKYIAPYREEADIVINNNSNYQNGFEILSCFISQKIEKYLSQSTK